MNELYEIKKEKAAAVNCQMHNPSTGAIPMKCSNTAVDNARKVVKFAAIAVYCRCCFIFALIGAIALFAVGFVLGEITFEGYTPDVIGVIMRFVSLGALAGTILGIIVSAIACAAKNKAENKRFEAFESVRVSLNATRLILSESAASVKDNPAASFLASAPRRQKGTLFLTMSSLEFYDKSFLTPHNNFLIKFSDIYCATSHGDRLNVETAKGIYKFKVPAGKARFWKKAINHATQYGVNIPVDNNY